MTTRAVLLDALGTLVELQPPAPRLRALLAEAGFEVSEEQAARGFGAEIEYYIAHHGEGSDRASLDELRDRCAEVMRAALALPGLDHAGARRAMLGALEFRAFDDVAPALASSASADCGSWWRATGTARCPTGSTAPGCCRSWTPW